jgi:hypothetical protein
MKTIKIFQDNEKTIIKKNENQNTEKISFWFAA